MSRIWLFYKESFVFWYIMVISQENSEDRILRALRFFFCFCNINVDAQIWTIFNKDRPVRDYFHFFLSRRIDAYIFSLSVILCHVLSEICCFQLCGIIYELMMSSSFFQYFIWITCQINTQKLYLVTLKFYNSKNLKLSTYLKQFPPLPKDALSSKLIKSAFLRDDIFFFSCIYQFVI